MRVFALMFALMLVQYALIAANTRFVARGRYLGVAATDAAIALFGFTLIQHVAGAATVTAQAGYIAGGVCGGCLGVWLTRRSGAH